MGVTEKLVAFLEKNRMSCVVRTTRPTALGFRTFFAIWRLITSATVPARIALGAESEFADLRAAFAAGGLEYSAASARPYIVPRFEAVVPVMIVLIHQHDSAYINRVGVIAIGPADGVKRNWQLHTVKGEVRVVADLPEDIDDDVQLSRAVLDLFDYPVHDTPPAWQFWVEATALCPVSFGFYALWTPMHNAQESQTTTGYLLYFHYHININMSRVYHDVGFWYHKRKTNSEMSSA